jgi:hypothetical protein
MSHGKDCLDEVVARFHDCVGPPIQMGPRPSPARKGGDATATRRRSIFAPTCTRCNDWAEGEHSRNLPGASRTFELGQVAPAYNRLNLLKT